MTPNDYLLRARNDLSSLMQKCSDIARIINQFHSEARLRNDLNMSINSSLIVAYTTFVNNVMNQPFYVNLMSNCDEARKLRSLLIFGNDQCQPSPHDLLKATINSQMPQYDFCDVFLKNNNPALTSSFSCPSPKEDDNFAIAISILRVVGPKAVDYFKQTYPDMDSYYADVPEDWTFVASIFGQDCLSCHRL